MKDRIKVGDYVRIARYMPDAHPVGIVKSIDGGYYYIDTGQIQTAKYPYECYEGELDKITKEEYFKFLLEGTNE